MPKIKDIFRLTVGRNHKERKYSKVRKPIMLLEDGTPIFPMRASEGRKIGAMIAEGIAAGLEKSKESERYIRAQKMRENLEKLSNMEYSGSDIEINSDSLDMVRYSFMNSEGEI
ncbi:hypothetical protein OCF62_09245 [Bacillus wiedmannii]|uniref:hypothetical protein n=1 Tax=Bacillus cereus group TaxID=86661 RepID=UPI0021D1C920|nr:MULTISPECIES: hypothetical protein [Bacillus cereus group]MCU5514760.1 hypothetical protein [Bacillus wiedmannii]